MLAISLVRNSSINTRKHPRAFWLLCATEIFERFGFYTMRAIIVLYVTKVLLFSGAKAYELFASFSALLYFSPLIGGYLGDKTLNLKYAILFGGLLLTIGYLLLAYPGERFFYYGLGMIIAGGGLFIPNLTTGVGQLYESKNVNREVAYSIFYGAVNIGAIVPPLIITSVILFFSWSAVFLLAGLSVFIGTIIFFVGTNTKFNLKQNILKNTLIFCSLFAVIICLVYLLKQPHFITFLVILSGLCFFFYLLNYSFKFNKIQRNQIQICLFLTVFSIIFEALLQQSAMSLTLFVDTDVNRSIGNWQISTVMFQVLNPLFIILLTPLFSKLYVSLDKKKLNPSIPTKFAYGTFFMGIGFILFPFVIHHSLNGQIYWGWVALSYFLQSIGELLVTPVGLSMISEWSPKEITNSMMGFWYFATAMGSTLGGFLSQLTISSQLDAMAISKTYGNAFGTIGLISIFSAFLILGIFKKKKFIF